MTSLWLDIRIRFRPQTLPEMVAFFCDILPTVTSRVYIHTTSDTQNKKNSVRDVSNAVCVYIALLAVVLKDCRESVARCLIGNMGSDAEIEFCTILNLNTLSLAVAVCVEFEQFLHILKV